MANVGNISGTLKSTTSLKPLGGPLFGKLKQVALAVDPAIDAAAVNYTIPDDAVHGAAKKAKKHIADMEIAPAGVNALFNTVNNERLKPLPGSLSFVGGGSEDSVQQNNPANSPAPKPPARESGLDQAMQLAGTALGYAGFGIMGTEMILPTLAMGAGAMTLTGVASTLNAPRDYLSKTEVIKGVTGRQALNDGLQIGFTALQSYGVAKGFVQNMAALKEMYADISGKDPRSISMMEILTGDVPPLVAEFRNHFLKEYGSRGAVQLAGWGLMLRDIMKAKFKSPELTQFGRIGFTAGMVPSFVGIGIDMLMGTAVTEIYSGFKKTYESGQPIAANEYAAFILASNSDLAKRRVGHQVAMEIGAEYANEKAAPGEILRQMNDGRFKARIEKLIAKDEAELAQKDVAKAQIPQPKAPAKEASKEVSMVDKIGGAKLDRLTIGKFTGRLNEENKGLPPGLSYTNP